MTARTYAAALSELSLAMMDVHERVCEIEPPHLWDRCTSTPSIFAVADGLDVLAAQPGDLPVSLVDPVALALHDRECQDPDCGPVWAEGSRQVHAEAWRDQASALLVHVSFARDHAAEAPPVTESRRGDLLARCECSHIRRGHSVDGLRCYASPCDCQVHGGFRPQVTGP